MNKILERIADRLTDIDVDDLSTAEMQIAAILHTEGYLKRVDNVYKRTP